MGLPEYSLLAPVRRRGEQHDSYTVSCVIDQLNATNWDVEVSISPVTNSYAEVPCYGAVLSASNHFDALAKAAEWFLPIVATVLRCTPEQVVLAHSNWQREV